MKKLSFYSFCTVTLALFLASCNDEFKSPTIDSLLPVTDTTIHVGTELSFNANIQCDETFSYSWFLDGEKISTDVVYIFTPVKSGEYTVKLLVENKNGKDSLEASVDVLPRILKSDFEQLPITGNGYWNGSDGSAKFTNGLLTFENSFNSAWNAWSGYIYSNLNDTITEGYGNQYSVFDASNNKNKFAVYYDNGAKAFFTGTKPIQVLSIKICNNSYTALSMLKGDAFAKKFGGATGADPDFYKVIIKGLDANNAVVSTLDFFLADFRSANNTEDYVVKKWTTVDISSLGKVNKLTFSLISSDNGEWGMNTPAYICIDDITYYELEE
jgi:PKD repeat protein